MPRKTSAPPRKGEPSSLPGSFDPDAAARPGSGLFGLTTPLEAAALVVIPVPFDATTSYRPGTARGPKAVLEASQQVDLLDREYGAIYEPGIALLDVPARLSRLSAATRKLAAPLLRAGGASPGNRRHASIVERVNAAGDAVNAWVRERARECLDRGQIAAVLGGDHSTPFGLIAELAEREPGLGILHFDAHADLRRAYEGFRWSHASIFHQVTRELSGVARLVQVGVRDFGRDELHQVESSGGRIRTHFDPDLRAALFRGESWDAICQRIVSELPERVYVSFDVDALSPDLCPHTGTPVPGGLAFAEATHLLASLVASGRRILGFDLCEVAPGPRGDDWDANVGSRLLYKLAGATLASQGRLPPQRP